MNPHRTDVLFVALLAIVGAQSVVLALAGEPVSRLTQGAMGGLLVMWAIDIWRTRR